MASDGLEYSGQWIRSLEPKYQEGDPPNWKWGITTWIGQQRISLEIEKEV
jgi:hypothetical protein